MAAGWGTPHPGIGKCKLHGGSTPTQVKSAATETMRQLLGKPVEITPEEAILKCIHIRQGEVVWLTQRIAELEEKHWVEDTMLGKQFHLYARERQAAMRDVAKFAAMAISMNIEERRVRLAENYGELLAQLIKGIIDDLMPSLSEEGRQQVPAIVKRHLVALTTQQPMLGPAKEAA
jgi:hypothetical protein